LRQFVEFEDESLSDLDKEVAPSENFWVGLSESSIQISLAREDTQINDKLHFVFNTQFLNAFNRVPFGPRGTQLGGSTLRQVTNQLNNPQQVQFSARIAFREKGTTSAISIAVGTLPCKRIGIDNNVSLQV
jgi:hypothetical protein